MFSKNVRIRDSNEAKVLAILEAPQIFSTSFQGSLMMESDSSNAISWEIHKVSRPWKILFCFNEINLLAIRSAYSLADALAKQGVNSMVQNSGRYVIGHSGWGRYAILKIAALWCKTW